MAGKNENLHSTIVINTKKKTLHLITQDDQPYGSRRKCCQECGKMVNPDMYYVDSESNFTKEVALKNNLTRCTD